MSEVATNLEVEEQTAVPESTPEAETPVPAETPEDSDGDVWSHLDSEFDLDSDDDDTSQLVDEKPEEPVKAEPEQPPAEPETPPVAEVPQPPQPEPEQPAPQQPQQQPLQPPSEEQVAQIRQQFMAQLAESYKPDEATAEAIDTNLSAVVPQLMSHMHMRIAESITQTLGQMLPQLISAQLQYMQSSQQNASKFYQEWPELQKPEYTETIARVAQMYRQMKPQATEQEFVRDVGLQAWMAVGLPPQDLVTRGQQTTPATPQPVQEPADLGGYRPATPGAPARSQVPRQPSSNPFAQLAEEFLMEDM